MPVKGQEEERPATAIQHQVLIAAREQVVPRSAPHGSPGRHLLANPCAFKAHRLCVSLACPAVAPGVRLWTISPP